MTERPLCTTLMGLRPNEYVPRVPIFYGVAEEFRNAVTVRRERKRDIEPTPCKVKREDPNIGRRFGYLTIERRRLSGFYTCRCSCGAEILYRVSDLKKMDAPPQCRSKKPHGIAS